MSNTKSKEPESFSLNKLISYFKSRSEENKPLKEGSPSQPQPANQRNPVLSDNFELRSSDRDEASTTDEEAPLDAKQEKPLSLSSLPKEKKLIFALMALSTAISFACFSLFSPFFPMEAARKGVSQTVTGIIFSCYEFWVFASAPFFGNYMKEIGSHFLVVAGLFLCGGTTVLFGLVNKSPPGGPFIALCISLRTVESLGAAAFNAASFAIVANEFPEHVNTVIGLLETFIGLGLMSGPPIGGALYDLGGFGLPFWVTGSVLLACSGFMAWILPEGTENEKVPSKGSLRKLLGSPMALVITCNIAGSAYAVGSLQPTLAVHLEQFHLRALFVGLIFVVPAALYGFSSPLWGYLSDTLGIANIMMIIGNAGVMLSFILLGPSPILQIPKAELWLVIVSLVLFGVFNGAIQIGSVQCLIDCTQALGLEDNLETYGAIAGLYHSAFSLGTLLGATLGSISMEHLGFAWSATTVAGLFLVNNVIFSVTLSFYKTRR